ncbi:MAG: glycosyltransferase family 39 protein, partial [Microcoleaceae cyanobacterium]
RYCQAKSIKLKQGLFNLPLISKFIQEKSNWWGIYIVGILTLIGCLIWLPFLQGVSENELVSWIKSEFSIEKIFLPSMRIIAWILTMVFLLPVEGVNLSVIIISSVIMLTYFIWVIYPLWHGFKLQFKRPASFPAIQILTGIFVSAIALFLLIIYVRGADISVAPRYHFIYFPTLILLVAASLGIFWQNPDKLLDQVNITAIKDQSIFHQIIHKIGQILWANTTGKQVVIITLVMGLLGSLTVVNNYGYQKSRDSDLLVNQIQTKSKSSIVIATSYETFAEVRALMALGLEFYNKHNQLTAKSLNNQDNKPRFILVETSNKQTDNPNNLAVNIDNLSPLVLTMSRPVDFWAVNLKDMPDLSAFNCQIDSSKMPKIKGYKYRHYSCL